MSTESSPANTSDYPSRRPSNVVRASLLCASIAIVQLAISVSILWNEARTDNDDVSFAHLVRDAGSSEFGYASMWIIIAIGLFFNFAMARWTLIGWALFYNVILPLLIFGPIFLSEEVFIEPPTATESLIYYLKYFSPTVVLATTAIVLTFTPSARAFYSAKRAAMINTPDRDNQ